MRQEMDATSRLAAMEAAVLRTVHSMDAQGISCLGQVFTMPGWPITRQIAEEMQQAGAKLGITVVFGPPGGAGAG